MGGCHSHLSGKQHAGWPGSQGAKSREGEGRDRLRTQGEDHPPPPTPSPALPGPLPPSLPARLPSGCPPALRPFLFPSASPSSSPSLSCPVPPQPPRPVSQRPLSSLRVSAAGQAPPGLRGPEAACTCPPRLPTSRGRGDRNPGSRASRSQSSDPNRRSRLGAGGWGLGLGPGCSPPRQEPGLGGSREASRPEGHVSPNISISCHTPK